MQNRVAAAQILTQAGWTSFEIASVLDRSVRWVKQSRQVKDMDSLDDRDLVAAQIQSDYSRLRDVMEIR